MSAFGLDINKITKDNIIDITLHQFPELESEFKGDLPVISDNLTTCFFDILARCLRKRIDQNSELNIVARIYDYINYISHSQSQEIINIIHVGILENLADDPVTVKSARANLKSKALELFEELSEYLLILGPRFYAYSCIINSCKGKICFRKCSDGETIILMCDECGAIWKSPTHFDCKNALYDDSYTEDIPGLGVWFLGKKSGWATIEEINEKGWEMFIIGQCDE